jgi:succinoglycan biosynthesis transport protein ExoP
VIPGKQYRPRDLLRIAWWRRYTILVPAIAVAGTCAVWARSLPDKYQSDALILVVPQRIPENYVRSTTTSRIDGRVHALTLAFLTRSRLEPLIREFALYAGHRRSETMEDLVERMRNDIDIEIAQRDSLRVSFVASDRRTAMRVVERLVSQLIEESRRDRETLAEETNRFLEAQVEDTRLRLVANEQRIETYYRRHADELPAQLSAILQAQHTEELRLQSLLESITRSRDRRVVLDRMLADTSTPADAARPAPPSPTAVTTAEQLRTAEASLAALLVRLTPRHPDVVRLTQLTADLRQKAADEPPATVATTPMPSETDRENRDRQREMRDELSSLDERLTMQLEEETRVRAALIDTTKRINAMPVRESELADLTRDYQTLQENYRALLGKKEEARVAADLEHAQIGEQFKILDAARMPLQPSSPNRPRIYLLGLMAGLALGLTLATAREYFDLTLRSEADVLTALNVPVVALIPSVVGRPAARRNPLILWSRPGIADDRGRDSFQSEL